MLKDGQQKISDFFKIGQLSAELQATANPTD
jgi:hypothetical protein